MAVGVLIWFSVTTADLEGLKREDEGDENGETLLREARDVGHVSRQVEGDDDHQKDEHPGAHPEPEVEIRQTVRTVTVK